MTELRKQINNIVEDYNACKVLAESLGSSEVYEGTTATADDILVGKTAYSNGELITGILEENESNTILNCAKQTNFSMLNSIQSISNLDVSGVTSMNNAFRDCLNLKSVSITNCGDVKNMASLFWNCKALKTIDFVAPNVTNMYGMFWNCHSLKTVPNIGATKITNFCSVFLGCSQIQEVPYFDTSNVSSLFQLFMNCTSLVTIPVLNTANVTNMGNLVRFCNALSDESLNNIMAMCINVKSDAWKTLNALGMTNTLGYRCQSLPLYNDFINAGWSLGYR